MLVNRNMKAHIISHSLYVCWLSVHKTNKSHTYLHSLPSYQYIRIFRFIFFRNNIQFRFITERSGYFGEKIQLNHIVCAENRDFAPNFHLNAITVNISQRKAERLIANAKKIVNIVNFRLIKCGCKQTTADAC